MAAFNICRHPGIVLFGEIVASTLGVAAAVYLFLTADSGRDMTRITKVVAIEKMMDRTTLDVEKEVKRRIVLKQPFFEMGPFVFCHTSHKAATPGLFHLTTFHNVRVKVKETDLCNETLLKEIKRAMRILIQGFKNDNSRVKVINDVYAPWLLEMLMSSDIEELDYINIDAMENISRAGCKWLVNHTITLQLMNCTFSDCGAALCKHLDDQASKVEVLKLFQTTIDGQALGKAVEASAKLVELDVADKRDSVDDRFWMRLVEAVTRNQTITSTFISGLFRDATLAEHESIASLRAETHRRHMLYLLPRDA